MIDKKPRKGPAKLTVKDKTWNALGISDLDVIARVERHPTSAALVQISYRIGREQICLDLAGAKKLHQWLSKTIKAQVKKRKRKTKA